MLSGSTFLPDSTLLTLNNCERRDSRLTLEATDPITPPVCAAGRSRPRGTAATGAPCGTCPRTRHGDAHSSRRALEVPQRALSDQVLCY